MGPLAAFATGLTFAAAVVTSAADGAAHAAKGHAGVALATAIYWPPPFKLSEEHVVVAWSAAGAVSVVRSTDGSLLWQRQLGNASEGRNATVPLVRVGGGLMIGRTGPGHAAALDLSSGHGHWGFNCQEGHLKDAAALDEGFLMVCHHSVSLVGFDGKTRWIKGAGYHSFLGASVGKSGEICVMVDAERDGVESRRVESRRVTLNENGTVSWGPAQVLAKKVAAAIRSGDAVLAAHSAAFKDGKWLRSVALCGAGGGFGDGSFDLTLVQTRPPAPYHVMPWRSAPGVVSITNGHFMISFHITPESKTDALTLLRIENALGFFGVSYAASGEVAADGMVVGLKQSAGWHVQEGTMARSDSDGVVKLTAGGGGEGHGFRGAAEDVVAVALQQSSKAGVAPRIFALGDAGSLMAMQGDKKLWEKPAVKQTSSEHSEL